MSDEAKWSRLLHGLPHLTEAMATTFCMPDPSREICVVIEGIDRLAGEILGGARIAGASDGCSAEFAMSLRPEAQGCGLARQALETVLAAAREMGYRKCGGRSRAATAPCWAWRDDWDFRRHDKEDLSLMHAELRL